MLSRAFILDTNIVLDCFLFKDPMTITLCKLLKTSQLRWIATHAMELEYLRVLTYPNVMRRVNLLGQDEQAQLSKIFTQYAHFVDKPEIKTPPYLLCRDKDDQIFIDLAIFYQGVLLSKDDEVLRLRGKQELTVLQLDQFNRRYEKYNNSYATQ